MLKRSFVTSLLVTSAIYPGSRAQADVTDLYTLGPDAANSQAEVKNGQAVQFSHNIDSSDGTKYQGTATVDNGGTLILNGVQAPTVYDGQGNISNSGLNISMTDPGSALQVSTAGASIGSLNGEGSINLQGDLNLNGNITPSTSFYHINSLNFKGNISGTGNFIYSGIGIPSGSSLILNLTLAASDFKGAVDARGASSLVLGDGNEEDKFFSGNGQVKNVSSLTVNNAGLTKINGGSINNSGFTSGEVVNFSSVNDVFFSGDNTPMGKNISIGYTPAPNSPPVGMAMNRAGFVGQIGGLQQQQGGTIMYLAGGVKTPTSDNSLTVEGDLMTQMPLVRGVLPELKTEGVETERGKITVDGQLNLVKYDHGGQLDWNLSPKNTSEGRYDDPITAQSIVFTYPPGTPYPFYVTSGGAVAMDGSTGGGTTVANSEIIREAKTLNPGLYRIFEFANTVNNGLPDLSKFAPQIDQTDQDAVKANNGIQLNMINIPNGHSNADGTTGGEVDLLVSKNQPPGLFWGGSGTTWSAGGSDTNWHPYDTNNYVIGTGSQTWAKGQDAYFVADPGTNGTTIKVDGSQGAVNVGNIFFANRLTNPSDVGKSATQRYTLTGDTLHLQNPDTYISVGASNPAQEDVNLKAQIDTVLDGSSTLTKDGAGTLILSQENTYSGTTTIDAGTLQLGDGGTEGKGSINNSQNIDIQRYGGLAIDHQNNFDLTQNITSIGGAGEIDQEGTGVTNLKGDASGFTGDVNVTNGTLNIENKLGTNNGNTDPTSGTGPVNVTVSNGGWLTGNSSGIIGGKVTVEKMQGDTQGGTIGAVDHATPPTGNTANAQPDTGPQQSMKVDGDLYMMSGSTLATSLTATSANGPLQASQVNVTGKAYLNGATLSLINSNYVNSKASTLDLSKSVTILTAGGGLYLGGEGSTTKLTSGNVKNGIDTPTSSNPSLFTTATYDVSADDTALDVTLSRNSTNFGDYGQTHNEISTGYALNGVSQSNEIYKAFSKITDPGMARQALNNLSGEIHASVRTGLIQDSMLLSNAVMTRLDNANCDFGRSGQSVFDMKTGKKNASCEEGHTVLWGQAYGSIGHNSGDGNAAGMSHNTAGFIMGVDTAIHQTNWRVGGFAAYGHSMFNVGDGRSSSANSNNISVGGYAGTHWGRLNLRMGGSYSWNLINTRRQIAVGDVGGRATSRYLGGTAQGFAELGYKMHLGRTTFEPFANVTYINMQTNKYRERGTAAALNGRGQDNGVTFSSFGFRAATRFNIGKAVFMPHLSGAYRHAFGNTGSKIHQSFAAGSQDMGINGVFLSNNAAVINTGITARLTDRIDLDVSYIGQYGNRSVDSGATGSFKFRF